MGPIAELSFDLDQKQVAQDPKDIVVERHVFVSGLARAGTTVLMRRIHATGVYRSLTYRDMPFVLAPNLWAKLARTSRRKTVAVERAHGDSILVGIDSPESLDEVFWRIFTGAEYIEKTHLKPHAPDDEIVWKYVCYVNAVLASQELRAERYLSKNNNNILRLAAIRKAFPNALILVPFRAPLHHAGSLLRQHRQFSRLQAQDRFIRCYMGWLVHHEFGLDHRPFRFADTTSFKPSPHPVDSLDYWLELWCETYEWLEHSAPEDALLVCYEDLCSDPEVWKRLAGLAGISDDSVKGERFRAASGGEVVANDEALAVRAEDIYMRLQDRSRAALY